MNPINQHAVEAPHDANGLAQHLHACSPRWGTQGITRRSLIIHGTVLLVWIAGCTAAIFGRGPAIWLIGLLYLAYDAGLQALTIWTAPRPHVDVPAVPGSPTTLNLTVIIAAHNEAPGLPATVASLLQQSRCPDQIIIADDGSTDHTAAMMARHYRLQPPQVGHLSAASAVCPAVHWLRLPHGGKAKALNNALTHTVADVFITVDADTLLAPGAMAAFEQAFASDARLVAATGVLTPQCGPAPFGRALQWFQTHEYIRNFLTRHAWMKLDCLLLISGALGAYRRQSVVEVGGFDPDSLVEDYELIHRLRRHGARHQSGWRTAVIGQARASTEAPSTLGAFLRQRRRWFGGFLQTQCAYRDMVGDATYGATGTRMLPIKAVDTVQPLAGLSAMAMLLWLLLHARWDLLAPALWVMALKAAVDMIFLAWAARTHARWTGADQPLHWPTIVMLPLLEPLTFQMARHLAALLGWIEWLWGTPRWGDPARIGLRPGHLLVDPTLPGHRGFADTDASMRHKQ